MDLSQVQALLEGRTGRPEELIEVLQDMQAKYNYLPKEGLRLVAERLGVPEIEVFQVAHFYKAFSLEPRGRHVLTVCTGTACHVRGAPRLMDAAVQKKRLNAMIAIDVVCLVVGVAAIVGNVAYDIAPLLWVFVAAAVIGMGAQIWFVRGLMKAGRIQ